MYTEADVTPWTFWRLKKSGDLYLVLGIAICSTNGPRDKTERSVVYASTKYPGLKYREVSEFLDGRFVPEDPLDPPLTGMAHLDELPL